jgi:hypothetical protein
MAMTEQIRVQRDTDPKYWVVIVNGTTFGGFKSEAEARRFLPVLEGLDLRLRDDGAA